MQDFEIVSQGKRQTTARRNFPVYDNLEKVQKGEGVCMGSATKILFCLSDTFFSSSFAPFYRAKRLRDEGYEG